jgi:hypothetical protein
MASTAVVLAAKLVLVPLLIGAITVAGARLGPRIAGVLTGLPVVAGPIVLFLASTTVPRSRRARRARRSPARRRSACSACSMRSAVSARRGG